MFFLSFLVSVNTFAASPALESPDLKLRDLKAKPCENFYQYACGGWIAKTKIPADKPAWSRGFAEIAEQNKQTLKEILEAYASGKNEPKNPYARKLGDFYSSCMNEAQLERGSLTTLKEEIKKLNELTNETLPDYLASLHLHGVRAFFSFGSTQDFKNPEEVIAETSQGGLGLPTKDYYLSSTPHMQDIRKQYVQHMKRMFELSGEKAQPALDQAKKILELETKLAEAALSPVEMRDPTKLYNRMKFSEFSKLSPKFNWEIYLKANKVGKVESLNVAVPPFVQKFNEILGQSSIEEVQSYLKMKILQASARALPDRFYKEHFSFYAKTLYGVKEPPVRWKRCVDSTNDALGFALGRAYVDLKFAGQSKEISQSMIEKISLAQGELIDGLPWMDSKTKSEAKEKLKNLANQVGYPDKWRSYDQLEIDKQSYLKNRFEGTQHEALYYLAKIGKPLDRTEWYMSPPEVNAYYDAQMAKMVFPAGILQPPFFHSNYSMSANYGGIGMVMGHEISHGFDDQGRQFDAKGSMRDWWTEKSATEFKKRAQCLVDQYEKYPIAGGRHVNGKLTLGENIGDQGGIKISYLAWKRTLPEEVLKDPKVLREEEQKFFLAFAQTWCSKEAEAYEKAHSESDPHPPSRYRVNGALVNFPAFAEAFQCAQGSKMAPVQQCVVW